MKASPIGARLVAPEKPLDEFVIVDSGKFCVLPL